MLEMKFYINLNIVDIVYCCYVVRIGCYMINKVMLIELIYFYYKSLICI